MVESCWLVIPREYYHIACSLHKRLSHRRLSHRRRFPWTRKMHSHACIFLHDISICETFGLSRGERRHESITPEHAVRFAFNSSNTWQAERTSKPDAWLIYEATTRVECRTLTSCETKDTTVEKPVKTFSDQTNKQQLSNRPALSDKRWKNGNQNETREVKRREHEHGMVCCKDRSVPVKCTCFLMW